jgi:hypothetical protein
MMNKTQKLLGLVLLVAVVAVTVFALAEIAPTLMASVGWNVPTASIGWHDLASVGWVTNPL